jgi:hypothetical protein
MCRRGRRRPGEGPRRVRKVAKVQRDVAAILLL